jgi:hypothetical protein
VIALGGNYCYFNFLTILLCLWLLDDQTLRRWLRRARPEELPAAQAIGPGRLGRALAVVWSVTFGLLAVLIVLVSFINLLLLFQVRAGLPQSARSTYVWLRPFGSINAYGLFAVMTTSRREIVIEGSSDGKEWLPYGFKYKPGDPRMRPGFVAPHQPRLDWQMWFAALGTYEENPWLINLTFRLLQNKPEVLGLLESNPFPAKPPKYVRAVAYRYHFTSPEVKRKTGAWWGRDYVGIYLPEVTLERK